MPSKHAVRRTVASIYSQPWAIEPTAFEEFLLSLELWRRDPEAESRVLLSAEQPNRFGYQLAGAVAVLPIQGMVAQKNSWYLQALGGTPLEQTAAEFRRALADPKARAIVLDVNSPGGEVRYTAEFANLVREARGIKPVIGVANTLAASAAYWILAQCEVAVGSPSSQVGSIGVLIPHGESSAADARDGYKITLISAGKYKADANAYEPLSEQGRATLQSRADALYQQFLQAVAQGRGVTVAQVSANYGEGRVLLAAEALAAGMIDRVATLDQVVSQLNAAYSPPARTGAVPSFAQEPSMNPILQALVELGLATAEATQDQITLATRSFFVARGQTVPTDEAAILAGLKAPAPQAQAPAPVAPVAPVAPAVTPAAVVPAPPPVALAPTALGLVPIPVDPAAATAAGAVAERTRQRDIRARCESLGIPVALQTELLDNGASIEQANQRIVEHLAQQNPPVQRGTGPRVVSEGCELFATAATELLFSRSAFAPAGTALSANARPLQHKGALQIATACLQYCGVRTEGMDDDAIAKLALGMDNPTVLADLGGSYNRVASFPNILSNLQGKMADRAGEMAEVTYDQWAQKLPPVADFKPKTILRMGEQGELPEVADGDDFTQSTTREEVAWIQVANFGDLWKLTPAMVVGDDLHLFDAATADKLVAAEATLNRLCVNLLTGNVTLLDAVALFHDGSHGNDITTGAGGPSVTQLSTIRRKLRAQLGVGQKRRLNLNLGVLLLPLEHETTAEQLLAPATMVPVTDATVNQFRGKVTPIVEPMLSDASATVFYGLANKERCAAICYTHQRGFERPKIEKNYNFNNKCLEWTIEYRVAAAVKNYRGVVRCTP